MMKTHPKYARILVCVLLILLLLVVYSSLTQCQFINYDDQDYVVQNSHVRDGLSKSSFVWAFTSFHASNWHPLTWLSHMLDYQLYGLNPVGHHLTNLLLHALNTLLLFLLLSRMTGYMWRSAFVAALFAFHPLHVESVAWVAERKDVLSAAFWLITIWAYIRYVARPSLKRYLLVPLALALGLMAKPMLVTAPFTLLLLDYWPLGRFHDAKPKSSKRWVGRKLLLEKAPLFALVVLSSAVTYVAQQKGSAVSSLIMVPLVARFFNAFVAYVMYIVKMVWPAHLAVFYPYPWWDLPVWQTILSTVLLVLVSFIVYKNRSKRPYLAVGWAWYIVTLVPVIGIVQVGRQSMADRYTYIPLLGIFIVVAWGIPDFLAKRRKAKVSTTTPSIPGMKVIVACACLALVALGARTWSQVNCWRTSATLFESALMSTSRNYIAQANLAAVLADAGKIEAAKKRYLEAIKINPSYAEASNGLGLLLAQQGLLDQARTYYNHALEEKPSFAEPHNNLGLILARQGKIDEAISEYRKALDINPDLAETHLNLGVILASQGHLDEAIEHYRAALREKPWSAETHSNMGVVLTTQGKLDEAIDHFHKALKLKPSFPQAHVNLGSALEQQGKINDAIRQYELAVTDTPDYVFGRGCLGNAYMSQKRYAEAIKQYLEIIKIDPKDPAAHTNLAVAYYHTHDYARSWSEVHKCESLDAKPNSDFLKALRAKMSDPGS